MSRGRTVCRLHGQDCNTGEPTCRLLHVGADIWEEVKQPGLLCWSIPEGYEPQLKSILQQVELIRLRAEPEHHTSSGITHRPA